LFGLEFCLELGGFVFKPWLKQNYDFLFFSFNGIFR